MMKLLKDNFIKKQLQLTKNTTGEYIIEKILKTKGNQIYIKLKGYSNNFNSWIDKNTVTKHL